MSSQSRSCKDAAENLKRCLRETECFQSGEFTMKECLQKTDECESLNYAHSTCMRGQLDMRRRIQGFKGTGDSTS